MTRAGLIAAIATLAIPTWVAAQQDSLMQQVVRLATEGRVDSARAIIEARLGIVSPSDPSYPEILFTAGVASDDVDRATAYFRRVSIEYGNSPWADQSLLRLAQLAYARGDIRGALRSAERLLIDYPSSDRRAGAAFMVARAYLDQRNPTEGCRYLNQAMKEAGEDIELANRAAFYLQRCADVLSRPPPDSAKADAPTGPVFSVQVAAVQNAAAANETMELLRRQGYDSHVFVEDDLFKVRVGRFRRKAEADGLVRELRAVLGGQPFVVETR